MPTTDSKSDRPGPLDPDQPHKPADDKEEVYFVGSPLLRGELSKLIGWTLAGLVLIAIPIVYMVLYKDHASPPLWVWAACLLFGAFCIAVPFLLVKRVRYRISNYRIDYERGLLSKSIDTLELWHVEDIKFHQSFLDRLFGVGTISIISGDATTPKLLLHSLPKPRPLFEQLKQRVIAVKRQRGVIKMDIG